MEPKIPFARIHYTPTQCRIQTVKRIKRCAYLSLTKPSGKSRVTRTGIKFRGKRIPKRREKVRPISKFAFSARRIYCIARIKRERERERRVGRQPNGIMRARNECIFFGEITAVFQQLPDPLPRTATNGLPDRPLALKLRVLFPLQTQTRARGTHSRIERSFAGNYFRAELIARRV